MELLAKIEIPKFYKWLNSIDNQILLDKIDSVFKLMDHLNQKEQKQLRAYTHLTKKGD